MTAERWRVKGVANGACVRCHYWNYRNATECESCLKPLIRVGSRKTVQQRIEELEAWHEEWEAAYGS